MLERERELCCRRQGDGHVMSQEVRLPRRRRCSAIRSIQRLRAAASFNNYCQLNVPTNVAWQRRSAVAMSLRCDY